MWWETFGKTQSVRGQVDLLAEATERHPRLPGERDVDAARCKLLERVDVARLAVDAKLAQQLALEAAGKDGMRTLSRVVLHAIP